MSRRLQSDKLLFGTVVALVLFGTLMVFSASAVMSQQLYGSSYHFVIRQLIGAVLGLTAMAWMMNWDYRRLGHPALIFSLVALLMGLLGGVLLAARTHHTHRWFHLGLVDFQPSELAKIVVVIFIAYLLGIQRNDVNEVRHTLLPIGIVTGLTVGLILKEPDLGTALAIVMVAAAMLFSAGLRIRYFVGVAAAGVPVLYLLIFHVTYRLNRLLGFLYYDKDPRGKGFQMLQSLIAVGTGGINGAGLMEGKQKLFFLPEPHTDFIYAVISEEWGFLGAVLVLVAFGIILYRGLRAAAFCSDPFGKLLAIGLTVMLVGQAMVNVSVVVGLIPTKGIPLPFVSYGGSSLLVNLIAVGILLNISQQAG
jgi:cell division protein FtsW